MPDLIDRIYFQELSEQNPKEVCRRTTCSYDDTESSYAITVWGDLYKICPRKSIIRCDNQKHERLHPYFELFILHYLLKAKEIEPANQWISEKDIPGGPTFFRGPHEIPTSLIASRFNNDIEGFKIRCEKLMGRPLKLADAAFVFKITPRVPVAVLYWRGDDEFPTEAKILYDRTIQFHFELDVIYALAVGVCERIGKSAS